MNTVNETRMIFRTGRDAAVIPAGAEVTLTGNGGVKVSDCRSIRIYCASRESSACPVTLVLMAAEGEETLAPLDRIVLAPGEKATRAYDVPGTSLILSVQADRGGGAASLDAILYGYGSRGIFGGTSRG